MTDAVNLEVRVGQLSLPNPILSASGCCGYGHEFAELFALSRLGGLTAKALSLEPRVGNAPPRVAEVDSGMLNAVGLQNPGWDAWAREDLPWMLEQDVAIIQNVVGHTVDDYVELSRRLDGTGCARSSSTSPVPTSPTGLASAPMRGASRPDPRVREVTTKPLWVKLTPQVSSIVDTARAAARAAPTRSA